MTELWLCTCGAEIHRRSCHKNQYHRLKMGCDACKKALAKDTLTYEDFTIPLPLMQYAIAHAIWQEERHGAI